MAFEIRLSKTYAYEHLDSSSLPGTLVNYNGHGVLISFTLGELFELRSRADYYNDPDLARESGMHDLYKSARKVVEQIKRAGLWETARTAEARAAYDIEYDARKAIADAQWAAYTATRDAR